MPVGRREQQVGGVVAAAEHGLEVGHPIVDLRQLELRLEAGEVGRIATEELAPATSAETASGSNSG